MKKMLALLLTLCLLAGLVPLGAGAEGETMSVTTVEQLTSALEEATDGDVITLGADLVVDPTYAVDKSDEYTEEQVKDGISVPFFTINNSIILDLNQHKISWDVAKAADSSDDLWYTLMFFSVNGANVTIRGNGTIDAEANYSNSYGIGIVNGGNLTIENGTYTGATTAVQVTNGSLKVYDGSFDLAKTIKSVAPEYAHYAVNAIDSEFKNGNAKIELLGGRYCYNYADFPEGENTTYIADGYTVIEKDGQYVVEKLGANNAVASVGDNYFKSVADAVEEAAKNNGTVILLRDAMFDTLSLSTGSVTVDLSGYRLTSDSGKTSDVTNSSKLIIQDSRGTGKLVYNGFRDPAQAAFEIQAGSSITLNGTHYETSGTGVFASGNAATVNVQGTVIDSKGYCVGTNAGEDENYNVAIRITDGSVLTSALDGAGTAVLFNVPGTLDIENSTLNGHWQGIIARGGTITVRDSVITNTYGTPNTDYEDKWESGNGVTVAGIAIGNKGNNDYNYPVSVTLENTSVTSVGPNPAIYVYQMEGEKRTVTVKISGDSAVSGDFIVEKDANVEKVDVSISGGYFTSDPSEYCAEGLTGLPGQYVVDGNTYQYMVGKKLDEDVKVATGETEAKTATGVNMEKDDVEKISETKAVGLTPEANDTAAGLSPEDKATKEKYNAAADTLSDQIPEATNENIITTVIAPRLEIEITGYDNGTAEATEKSLTLNIEAVYDIKATTKADDMEELNDDETNASSVNTVTIKKNAGTLDTTGQEVVISIPLPDGFVTSAEKKVYVQHKNTYEYEATVTETGTDPNKTYTATFTNPHGFSTFVLSTEPKAVATVNGTNYTNFQQAIKDAGSSNTITVKQGDLSANGVTHDLKLENGTGDEITVTINGEKITIPAGGTETFTYTAPTPPRPTEEKHSITISTDGKGQVTGPASAAEDDKVTLTVKPNADKELYDLKVTDEDGKAIAVTKVNDTTYTFTMPDGKVTIAATFGCDGGDNCPSKAFTDLGDKQWYHDFIDYAVENGLLEGTSATTMEPNATLIRAQLAQILYNIEDKPAVTGEMIFEDVPASEWFYSPVLWANQSEIINGTSPTTFEPLENISRQDLALMLYRYAGEPKVTGDLDGFTDADQVGDWAEEAMAWAVAEGIVQGDTPTTLNPTGTATRAEAAAMLQRFLEDVA